MSDINNNNDNSEITEICYICRRTITDKKDIFHMPNGVSICQECLRKTMDQVSSMDFSNVLFNGAGFNAVNPKMNAAEKAEAFPENKENIDAGIGREKEETTEDPGKEQKEEEPYSFQGMPNISFLNLYLIIKIIKGWWIIHIWIFSCS